MLKAYTTYRNAFYMLFVYANLIFIIFNRLCIIMSEK